MINYHNKTFRSVTNTANGEVSSETIFHYQQQGFIVTARYYGGAIINGHLIAIADAQGKLNMRYHHINNKQQIMTGICVTEPELLPTGKLRLHENWQWTSGDTSSGTSLVEEI